MRGQGLFWTKARSTLALPVWHCRRTLKGSLEQNYLFVWNSWLPVISYPGHFVPTLVISYLHFGHFVPSNNHFVPRSFRTYFGHFVPRSTGYEMTIFGHSYPSHFVPFLIISYPFWSFRTQQRWMDGWMDGWVGGWIDRWQNKKKWNSRKATLAVW